MILITLYGYLEGKSIKKGAEIINDIIDPINAAAALATAGGQPFDLDTQIAGDFKTAVGNTLTPRAQLLRNTDDQLQKDMNVYKDQRIEELISGSRFKFTSNFTTVPEKAWKISAAVVVFLIILLGLLESNKSSL
jgi:hypothetical protein